MTSKDPVKTYYPKSRGDWRKWLNTHHEAEKNVWLVIYHKDSVKHNLTYEEAVEEALCFGWIDSKPNKRDEESYCLFFSKRKPGSNWSKANRERAQRLVDAGLMTPAGQALIDKAKETGSWTALEEVQNSVIPPDLQSEFDRNSKAYQYFMAFPPSSKRIILEWILNAKKPETRQQRIKQTVELAEKNRKANHYRQ